MSKAGQSREDTGNQTWESWKQQFGESCSPPIWGKSYSEAEDAEKKRVWEATLAEVTAHNLKYDQGLVSYQLGINQFAVEGPPLMSSPGEAVADSSASPTEDILPTTDVEIPQFVDYRIKGWVTSVKNQGKCGSCYAFAAVGVLEAQNKKTNGKLVSLSAQQLVDCSPNHGCEKGMVSRCFIYAQKNGLATDEEYPYMGEQGDCKKKKTAIKVQKWWVIVGEASLKLTIAKQGPATVLLHVPKDFRYIDNDTDVYDSTGPGIGWHAVLVVGYGTINDVDYWIIKNSTK